MHYILKLKKWIGVLFALAVILLALGNCWVPVFPFGSAVYMRPLVSLTGILGATCLLIGYRFWWLLLPSWAICQSFIYAPDISGPWFYQGITLGFSQHNSYSWTTGHWNVESHRYGLTTTGIVLFVIILVLALLRLHPPYRNLPIPRSFLLKTGIVSLLLSITAFVWVMLRPDPTEDALFILKLDIPHVPIYYQDQFLGYTPLIITKDKIQEWKLPINPDHKLVLMGRGYLDCLELCDTTANIYLPLYAGQPWIASSYIRHFPTPFGERYGVHVGRDDGKYSSGNFVPKPELLNDPQLTIQILNTTPIRPLSKLNIRCTFKNTMKEEIVSTAGIMSRHAFSFGPFSSPTTTPSTQFIRSIPLSDSWKHIPSGQTITEDFEFTAPPTPGDYEFFCDSFLESKQTGGSCFSNILVLKVEP